MEEQKANQIGTSDEAIRASVQLQAISTLGEDVAEQYKQLGNAAFALAGFKLGNRTVLAEDDEGLIFTAYQMKVARDRWIREGSPALSTFCRSAIVQDSQDKSLKSMSNQVSEMREVLEDERVSHKKAIDELEDKLCSEGAEVVKQTLLFCQANDANDDLLIKVQNLTTEKGELEDERSSLVSSMESEIKELNTKLDAKRAEIITRNEIVIEKNKEIVCLEGKVDTLTTEKAQIQHKHTDLDQRYIYRTKQWNTFSKQYNTFWKRVRLLFFRPLHYQNILVHDED